MISVTAIKQAFEDYRRHKADKEVNMKRCDILHHDGGMHPSHFQDVVVGDVVRVDDGEEIPCDMVMLSSGLETCEAFIVTTNLDGETSLKVRTGISSLHNMGPEELALVVSICLVICALWETNSLPFFTPALECVMLSTRPTSLSFRGHSTCH